MFKYTALYRH